MEEFEAKFIKNGKEIDTFIINAEDIEEAIDIAEALAYGDGVCRNDLEVKRLK